MYDRDRVMIIKWEDAMQFNLLGINLIFEFYSIIVYFGKKYYSIRGLVVNVSILLN